MSDRIRVYVAGPLSKGDRMGNVRAAIDAGQELIELGYAPLVPHLSHYMDETDALGHDTWLAVDLPWVDVCDALLRLPGESVGADMEVARAESIGIPVYYGIEELESNPPRRGDDRFHRHLRQLGILHDRKQRDYGRATDPFANVRASVDWGVPAWIGTMIRATDKLRRLQTFAQTGTLANEGVKDSLQDLAVYSLIALVLMEEEEALENEQAA